MHYERPLDYWKDCSFAKICAIAALIVRHKMKSSGRWARAMAILRKFEEKCGTSVGKLRQVADIMAVGMHVGLASKVLIFFPLALGDFNAISHISEKKGGSTPSYSTSLELNNVMSNCNMLDIRPFGPKYTWTNKQISGKNIQERLDRALVNEE